MKKKKREDEKGDVKRIEVESSVCVKIMWMERGI